MRALEPSLGPGSDPYAVLGLAWDGAGPLREHGWITAADDVQRLDWLLSLPREEPSGPWFELEVPDVWDLVETIPELALQLRFAQSWLSRRSVRTTFELDGDVFTVNAVTLVRGEEGT